MLRFFIQMRHTESELQGLPLILAKTLSPLTDHNSNSDTRYKPHKSEFLPSGVREASLSSPISPKRHPSLKQTKYL